MATGAIPRSRRGDDAQSDCPGHGEAQAQHQHRPYFVRERLGVAAVVVYLWAGARERPPCRSQTSDGSLCDDYGLRVEGDRRTSDRPPPDENVPNSDNLFTPTGARLI